MIPKSLWLLCLSVLGARARSTGATQTSTLSTLTAVPTSNFEGSQYTYLTPTAQSTVTSTSSLNATSGMSNGTAASTSHSQSTRSQSSNSLLNIAGTASSRPSNGTATTSSAPLPSNTLPCNNHPEFCNRKYSNITEVCAHNSAFDIKNNAASNQALSISDQLNDGIRMRKQCSILFQIA